MNHAICEYKTIVFDCDGVILNSNKIKSDAFFKAALVYGQCAAQQFLDYHIAGGGASRYEKFKWFVENIVQEKSGPSLDQLLVSYATEVRRGLLACDISESLLDLREKTKGANWLIVSGGDQEELRDVFAHRNIDNLFDGGIFGSPESKNEIISAQISSGNIKTPALFIGDSRSDYISASAFSLDFIFLHGWSDLVEWESFCTVNQINYAALLDDLLLEK